MHGLLWVRSDILLRAMGVCRETNVREDVNEDEVSLVLMLGQTEQTDI